MTQPFNWNRPDTKNVGDILDFETIKYIHFTKEILENPLQSDTGTPRQHPTVAFSALIQRIVNYFR